MKINRMSDEGMTPDWALSLRGALDNDSQTREASAELEKVELPTELTEDELIDQRDLIEQCAAAGATYRFSATWSKNQKGELKEYALACGLDMDSFVEVSEQEQVVEASEEDVFQKVASGFSETVVASDETPRLVLNDPFGLDEIEDRDLTPQWERIEAEKKLSDKPSMMTNAVKPIGGGEDYLANSDVPLASNQNSIVNPSAIEQLANSEVESTGERLARQAKEKQEQKALEHQQWQQDKVDAMEHRDELPKGTVFPTESMNAQPGLNTPSSQMGVYSNFDVDSIPEKTAGEQIADQNEARRQAIRGEEKEKHEFKIQSEASRSISDDFTESLKKNLGL
jgi:hypothetical protein